MPSARRLLIFAKAPRPGHVKSRLARTLGAEAACRIYHAFLSDLAENLIRPFEGTIQWWVDGPTSLLSPLLGDTSSMRVQPEGDLGVRLTTAFDAAFAENPGPVVAIGTDCPLLGSEELAPLFLALEAGADCALIPAEDGGYAAIGFSHPCPEAFTDIAWSTERTLADTLARLENGGKQVTLLSPLADVDDEAGLDRLIRSLFLKKTATLPATRETLRALGLLELDPANRAIPDDLGRAVTCAPPPQRLISLVPGVTESLFDLGVGDRVVGRTDYCISPAEQMERIPSVGGPKTVELEKLLALKPDLVFADAEENDRDQIEALIDTGVRVFIALPRTLADGASFLRRVGQLVDRPEAANAFALEIDALPPSPTATAIPTICLIWRDPWMAAASDTFVGAILSAAGCHNVVKPGAARYPIVKLVDDNRATPQLILLPSEPYPFGEAEAKELQKQLPDAVPLPFPGEWVSWYGCRIARNVKNLSRLVAALEREM